MLDQKLTSHMFMFSALFLLVDVDLQFIFDVPL
jgi:hypothetical protein